MERYQQLAHHGRRSAVRDAEATEICRKVKNISQCSEKAIACRENRVTIPA